MGASRYIQDYGGRPELKSDAHPTEPPQHPVIQCWQLSALHRTPPPPNPACRLGYKANQAYVTCWICVQRGGRKCPVPKGVAYGNLEFLLGWLRFHVQILLRLFPLIHSIKLPEETLMPSGSPNQCTSAGRPRADNHRAEHGHKSQLALVLLARDI
uniref:Ribosomal protein L15 n=1 Tax=Panthera leo TaxID=9689 RepID=A0A8C8XFW4_PANLE